MGNGPFKASLEPIHIKGIIFPGHRWVYFRDAIGTREDQAALLARIFHKYSAADDWKYRMTIETPDNSTFMLSASVTEIQRYNGAIFRQ